MRRLLCLIIIFLFPACLTHAEGIPRPEGWVNDFAGVISQEYKDKLNSLAEEIEQKTSSEIAVVAIDSIAPYDEKAYARLLFDSWKPGKKGKDNGVLVLLAVRQRRWRIETGYGLEGILPDGLCGEIGRNYMVAYFKAGHYGKGLYLGTLKIAQIIAEDAHVNLKSLSGAPQERIAYQKHKLTWDDISFLGFIIFLFLIFLIPSLLGEGDSYYHGGWGGGFGGGGGGGFGGGGGGGGGAGGGF